MSIQYIVVWVCTIAAFDQYWAHSALVLCHSFYLFIVGTVGFSEEEDIFREG